LEVAAHGAGEASRRNAEIAHGVNTVGGQVTNGPVAEFLGVDSIDPLAALS
jgi:alanine dehydrogenase